jgi:hypothetical protein
MISYQEQNRNMKLSQFTAPAPQRPQPVDLAAKYPGIIDVCRAHDCGYQEAIRILEVGR